MTLVWNATASSVRYKNPEIDFHLNIMARFVAQEKGLKQSDLDDVWWGALVELTDDSTGPAGMTINKLADLAQVQNLDADLYVPKEYDEDQRQDTERSLVTIFARRPYLNAANTAITGDRLLGVKSLVLGASLETQSLDFSNTANLIDDPIIPVPEGTVVTAVIDNAIAIGHDLFRVADADGVANTSRVAFFWNMAGISDPDDLDPPSVGRKWTKAQIDQLIADNLHAKLLDEPAFYRDLGVISWSLNRFSPCAQRVSHGTHVMGLCAGYDPADAILTRPIIAVNLPTQGVQNPSGNDLIQPLEFALDYIKKRHARFQIDGTTKKPPLVVNFSFGNFAGPHDGTSKVERAIDEAMSSPEVAPGFPKTAVLPAGNSNNKRCHALFALSNAQNLKLIDWRIQPGDHSESMVQFWTRKGTAIPDEAVTLTVNAPGAVGPVALDCTPGAPDQELKSNGEIVATLSYRAPVAPTNRGVFRLSAVPSAHLGNTDPFAPSGPWRITLTKGAMVGNFKIKSWIVRDETLPGFPEYGRQSYFDMPDFPRFKSAETPVSPFEQTVNGDVLSYDPTNPRSVRRAGTLSGFACGNEPAVIAGYVRSTRKMANYSASGPTNNPGRKGPDAAAVSDDTRVLSGILSAGSNSGSRVAMQGTSVSTPQVARWVADRMATNKLANRTEVRVQALIEDPPFPPSGQKKPPTRRAGGGRMALKNQFGKLRWPGQ